MSGRFDDLSEEARRKLEKASFPAWVPPMPAALTHDRFSDPGWLYERKLDGERCLVFRGEGGVQLLSRNRKELNHTYPEVESGLEHLCRGPLRAMAQVQMREPAGIRDRRGRRGDGP